jgi:signal transduction histidine kinase/ligand-binding sensor domain-containing protein
MKSTVLWIVALLLCRGSWSAEADLTLQQLIHKGWTVADGAPGNIIAIAQTVDGTLWLASPSGLSRFDGISFVRYNGPAGRPFESTGIFTVTASTDGGLWVGFTWGGISFLKNDTVVHYGEHEGLPVGTVRRILTDGNGVTYAATSRGLYRLESNRWESVVVDARDPKQRIASAAYDRAKTFWVATSAGVYARPVGTTNFRQITKPDMNNFSVPHQIGLAGGPDGAMWATDLSRPGGITRVEAPTDSAQIRLRELASGDTARAEGIFFDRDGNLWIGGANAIHRFAADTLTDNLNDAVRRVALFSAADGLTGTAVSCFFEDREGNIWVGTEAGLDRFSHSNVIKVVGTRFAYPAVVAGEAGTVWSSKASRESTSPLLEIRNNAVVKEWPALFIASAYRSPDGSIWFGGLKGLSHFDDGHVVTIALPETEEVQAMVQDRTSALWVSVIRKGVFRFANGQWSLNGNLPALPHLDAIVETADSSGNLWFGYRSNQIARIDGSSVNLFGTADGLHVGTVMAIAGGRSQHLWIGGELGLARFDGTRFVPVSSASGDSFRGISGIVELKSGDLWLNTSVGIVHLSEPELTHAERDAQYRVLGEVFDHLDGMTGYAVQVRPTPSAIEGTDGRLWFALTSGLVSIDPLQIKRNPLPPPVTIWSVSAGGTQYAAASEPRLPVHTTDVRIDYTAGSLTIPERVSFRYKLEGSDRDWQYAENRREVFYTNLGPGSYTFRVIAANNDGVWNMTGASVHFTIAPAFYQTAWFYALCALLCLAFLRFLYMIRIRQVSAQVRGRLEERLIERARIARDLHDTLLQSVQGLVLRLRATVTRMPTQEPVRLQMEQALERADEVLAEGRDRVQDLRSPGDDCDLTESLAALGAKLAIDQTAHFRSTVEGLPRALHPIVREEAMFIAREALVNAFRHANAHQIEVELSYGEAELRMRIRDDGRGLNVEVQEDGGRTGHWGVVGMRERAKKIRATLTIWSKPGAGTEVELRVPAHMAYRLRQREPFRWWRRESSVDPQN